MLGALLFALAILLLIIVCANVANLLLARGISVRREMAIRQALGASRARMMRMVLLESLILATLGGMGALGLAAAVLPFLSQFRPLPALTIELGLRMSGTLLLAGAVLSWVAGALLGVLPAWSASHLDAHAVLKDESGSVVGGRSAGRLRRALVVAQIALSVLLLSAAGLFVRSLANAKRIDLGFDPRQAMAIDVDVSRHNLPPVDAHRLFNELSRRLHGRSDIGAVAFSNGAPVELSTPTVDIILDHAATAPGQAASQATRYWASPEYFEAIRIAIVGGRTFADYDDASSQQVAIVNETMARQLWNGDAIGRRFRTSVGGPSIEVVGIARDSVYRTPGEARRPHVYVPFAQTNGQTATVIVRTTSDPRAIIGVVQEELERLPQPLEGFFGRTLNEHLRIYLLPSELAATIAAILGALAVFLASVGLYGVIACMVQERGREFAIRLMLGAGADRILWLVTTSVVRVLVPGIAIGAAGGLALSRFAQNVAYGVGSTDLIGLGAAIGVLTAVALLASYLPARRAMGTDPVKIIRQS